MDAFEAHILSQMRIKFILLSSRFRRWVVVSMSWGDAVASHLWHQRINWDQGSRFIANSLLPFHCANILRWTFTSTSLLICEEYVIGSFIIPKLMKKITQLLKSHNLKKKQQLLNKFFFLGSKMKRKDLNKNWINFLPSNRLSLPEIAKTDLKHHKPLVQFPNYFTNNLQVPCTINLRIVGISSWEKRQNRYCSLVHFHYLRYTFYKLLGI